MAWVSGQIWPTESGAGATAFDLSNAASGTETLVPGRWFEVSPGQYKPVYRRVVNFGGLPNNTVKSVPLGISASTLEPLSISLNGYSSPSTTPVVYNLSEMDRVSRFYLTDSSVFVRTTANITNFVETVIEVTYSKKSDPATSLP